MPHLQFQHSIAAMQIASIICTIVQLFNANNANMGVITKLAPDIRTISGIYVSLRKHSP